MSWYSHDSTQALGKVGKDAEMRYSPDGTAVTSFSIAVDRSYKSKEGEAVKRTIWYKVTVWGKLAEICKDVKKGDTIMAIGNLEADWSTGSPRIWNKQDGGAGASFELKANDIKFLSPKKETQQNAEPASEGDVPF